MNIVDVTTENIDTEHVCCAITEKKGESCAASKKTWMEARFADGLVFKKLDVRGKVFIEYMPAENAWCPIDADGCMYVDCLWVSGQYKGHGYGNRLLDACIEDAQAKGKRGLVVLSSQKKMPFLSEPGYLKHRGFSVADSACPYFDLLFLPFSAKAAVPRFRDVCREGKIEEKGMTLYYLHQCPHTEKYVRLAVDMSEQRGKVIRTIRIETAEDAKNAPSPFTTYSFFNQGLFVTNEIFGEKKRARYLDALAD